LDLDLDLDLAIEFILLADFLVITAVHVLKYVLNYCSMILIYVDD